VLIDGLTGAGKSWLTKALAQRLQINTLEVDELVQRPLGESSRYIDLIDFVALGAALKTEGPKIIDAITGLDVAEAIPISVTTHIYVQRHDRHGEWIDGEVGLGNELAALTPSSALQHCLANYHQRRLPHEICDAVFVRRDEQ